MKHIILILCIALLCGVDLLAQQPDHTLTGRVLMKEEGSPLPGALVTLGENQKVAISDEDGIFVLNAEAGEYSLKVSYVGMLPLEIPITIPHSDELKIEMESDPTQLQEVTVLSTGYQKLPAERVTGSFDFLEKELITRRVSTNLADRLEDVTSGLILNRAANAGNDRISIRGRSTLFANTAPLIIVDNFPYDGPLERINPNDVESITVLKDAAAASIWGARAGNGVIVITTSSGKTKAAPQVSLNNSLNFTEKADLLYVPQMRMGDFVDIEKSLFENNFYSSRENSPNHPGLPPAVETLIAARDGEITQAQADKQLEAYRQGDFRTELMRYYQRSKLNQQYALSVSGGGERNTYFFSLGYDQNRQGIVGNGDKRWTIQAKNKWGFLGDRLNWSVGAYLSSSNALTRTASPADAPYSRLRDGNGNPLPVYSNLSERYLTGGVAAGLLDWYNYPLQEIGTLDLNSDVFDGRFYTDLGFRIMKGLEAEVSYQYWMDTGRQRNSYPQSSYYVRDLINRFSGWDEEGRFIRNIPVGDILDLNSTVSYSHTLRGLIRYQRTYGDKHQINALVGTEVRDLKSEGNSNRYYGYNDQLGTSGAVDFMTQFPLYYNPGITSTIDAGNSHRGLTDRFISLYANAAYTYDNKLDLTFSIRKDQSNFFGVEANRKGVPLWSAGLGWLLSQEPFMGFLNGAYLKGRGSYGYSGNLDKNLSGELTARYFNQPSYRFIPNVPAADIVNPPNPSLSWEKVGIWNVGLDFESADSKLNITAEAYGKRGEDLIGPYEVPTSLGFYQVIGNFAQTYTHGMDWVVGMNWLNSAIKWRSDLIYSFVKDEVRKVDVDQNASALLNSFASATPVPVEGRPFFSVYSYDWAGLDPDNGDPLGTFEGESSADYRGIVTSATPENLKFHGSSRPTHFGALRNTFSWKGLSLSLNITYRLGYYYRRKSIDYFTLQRGQIGHGDYEKRWVKPGDELNTAIPSLPPSANSLRNLFYTNSAVLVEKGDHIRLQDIRLAYALSMESLQWFPFRKAEIYTYANNMGIIWKASKDKLDPDFQTSKPLRSIAFGLRVDF